MIDAGVFVIAVGRQKDRLDELVAKYGPEKIAGEMFNISDLDALGDWSKRYDLSESHKYHPPDLAQVPYLTATPSQDDHHVPQP